MKINSSSVKGKWLIEWKIANIVILEIITALETAFCQHRYARENDQRQGVLKGKVRINFM